MLFKKLENEVKKVEVRKEAKNITEQEKKDIEKELIFGNVLEGLEVDEIEKACKPEVQ